ncbi:DUF6442 family protein [uncultured Ruminococcus sp.]|uniref:DUF6442 family protein n=1 Tax=uncultured Ruminococcus sp. TaxID=165186 RepID=UPI0025F74025|nr:DUF6442 family protein [uncultured Ruminococcus sp.]
MDKEKILAMSRVENEKKDPFELEVANEANSLASTFMAAVTIVLFFTNVFARGNYDYGIWSILGIWLATKYGYTGLRMKKKKQVIRGIVWGILFLTSFTVGMIKLIRG